MDLTEREVLDLIGSIGRGDEQAMATLYRAFKRRVYAFVLTILKDPERAQDVVSDTLFEVWRNPAGFRGESRFSTWLLGIARYKALNVIRSRVHDHEELTEDLVCPTGEPMEHASEHELRRLVLEHLSALPQEQRDCLYLMCYEGWSVKDLANVQGCPENTIKTRLFHGRGKLRESLRNIWMSERDYVGCTPLLQAAASAA
jgi:RNA polymerase sigma-70 factor (ECF subfamily)